MFLSQQFGDHGRDPGKDRLQPDPPDVVPTHLLTMTRGAAEAVPERLISALRAMGIPARMLPGRGLGLVLADAVPEFLQRDPFHVSALDPEAETTAADAPPAGLEPVADDTPPVLPEATADDAPPAGPAATADDTPPAGPAATAPLFLRSPIPAAAPDPAEAGEAVADPDAVPEARPAGTGETDGSEDGATEDAGAEVPETEPEPDAAPGLRADKADRILERLDLLEFLLSEDRPVADSGPQAALEARMARIEDRLGAGETALAEGLARIEAAVSHLARRPPPTFDLTAQQRGFAAFGTAMATLQSRLEAVAARIESGQAAMIAELKAGAADGTPAVPAERGVEIEALSSLVTVLSDQLAAAHRPADPAPVLAPLLDGLRLTQERIAATLSQMQELPDTRMQAAQEDFLRSVRLIIAELLAEHRRATGA